jgi:uncharacterized protein YdeI (YjbR/CyaY-like superfamily)
MKTSEEVLELVCPKSKEQWRKWLQDNHELKESVWLVYYKKKADRATITWSEAVDEALCFGWIDSTGKTIDEEKHMQFFSRRKPKSTWSKINKDKIIRLTEAGLMTPSGQQCIDIAKANGSWELLDSVEQLIVPEDLMAAFDNHSAAKLYFDGLSRSVMKNLLQWLILAKRPQSRLKRIEDIVRFATERSLPKQFRP